MRRLLSHLFDLVTIPIVGTFALVGLLVLANAAPRCGPPAFHGIGSNLPPLQQFGDLR